MNEAKMESRTLRLGAESAGETSRRLESLPTRGPGEIVRVPTVCRMCGQDTGCGAIALVRDGRLLGLEGMKEAPHNRGSLCARAHAAPEWLYSPQRLKSPLVRQGGRRGAPWVPISWGEALDLLAERLLDEKKRYGAESLAVLSPARRSYCGYMMRLLMAHGSPNYGHSGICYVQRSMPFTYTLGGHRPPAADYAQADLMLLWGRSPTCASAPMGGLRALTEARRRGMRVVVIKPTQGGEGRFSDEWLALRPGTDAALALALLHVVIGEELYDRDFVRDWCFGFEELAEHVRQYTPQWAEGITGVPAGRIREVARRYASTPRAAIDLGNGVEHAPGCSDAARAIAMLIALTGHLERPGGNLWPPRFSMPALKNIELKERITEELASRLVAPEMPLGLQPWELGLASSYKGILDSILTEKPYPIRTLIAAGTQPLASGRGAKTTRAALEKVGFFVVVDVMETAEMEYADLVVPVATFLECEHSLVSWGPWLMAPARAVEPLGDYGSDTDFWVQLGCRLGYPDLFWDGDAERSFDEQLEPTGLAMAELRKHPFGVSGAVLPRTYERYGEFFGAIGPRLDRSPYLPRGKVALYNEAFEAAGLSPLPEWREVPEGVTATPSLAERFPLILSDHHGSVMYNSSWLRNVPSLRKMAPEPELEIHPEAARSCGVADGDRVEVRSPHGTMVVRARVTEDIRRDTVMILHGFWQGCEELGLSGYSLFDGGANPNNLYPLGEHARDPAVTANSSQTLVTVRRIE